jgi:hypothetical protein
MSDLTCVIAHKRALPFVAGHWIDRPYSVDAFDKISPASIADAGCISGRGNSKRAMREMTEYG